jgi:hypothetical protein
MLTVEGLGNSCIFGDCGLGKFMQDEDFACYRDGSIYACKAKGPNWEATLDAFKGLQATVRTISSQMSAAGVLKVPSQLAALIVDGHIGNATAIGVQFIGAAFMAAVKPDDPEVAFALTPSGDAQADIEKIATYAGDIAAYFNYVLTNHPEALSPPPEVVKEIVEVEKVIEKQFATRFRPIGAIVIAAGLLAALGITAASVYFMRREERYGDF